MSTQCAVCTSPTPNTNLCNPHSGELRATLTALAQGEVVGGHPTEGLLAALEDVANKQTRMGGGTGHRKRGDERPDPFEPDTEKGRSTKQGEAARLLDEAQNTLSTIIRDLCEERGVDIFRTFLVVPADLIGPLLPGWRRAPGGWRPSGAEIAMWLADHVRAIGLGESAGHVWREVDGLKRRIERVIDRPVPIEMLGLCSTQLQSEKVCDTVLRAREDAIEVRCPKCHTVRRCDQVRRIAQSDARKALIPWAKVLETNKGQPDGWRVNERTLRDWRATAVLRIRGYLRPNGRHGINRRSEEDVPLYAWVDVEQLRSQGVPKGHRKKAGAGK